MGSIVDSSEVKGNAEQGTEKNEQKNVFLKRQQKN